MLYSSNHKIPQRKLGQQGDGREAPAQLRGRYSGNLARSTSRVNGLLGITWPPYACHLGEPAPIHLVWSLKSYLVSKVDQANPTQLA